MAGGTGHAGDISPDEAIAILKSSPDAVLVDVRTEPEWAAGVPDTSAMGPPVVFVEWALPPAMTPNPDFLPQLEAALRERGTSREAPLLFLCRSGARSAAAAAAMTAQGYSRAHNVAGGFEGSPPLGLPGWRPSGQPWSRP